MSPRQLRAAVAASWPPIVLLAGLVALWEFAVRSASVSAAILPPPSRIADGAWGDRGALWDATLVTFQETALGLVIALGLAVVIAFAIDGVAWVRRSLYPLLIASQTIPIIAIAPLMVIWFGLGLTPKVLLVALYTFFPIVVGLIRGLAATDPAAVRLLRSMGARDVRLMRHLRVPAALPSLFTGLRIAATYAVVAAVIAEYVGAVDGLGIYMLKAKNTFETDLVFAGVGVTVVLTLALFALVIVIERIAAPWVREP